MQPKTSLGKIIGSDQEVANVLTHGLGLVLTMIGMPILILRAIEHSQNGLLIGVVVFAISMFLVYLSSTLYHSFQQPKLKHRLRKFDHICIYYLIAGTYTPLLLAFLTNSLGILMLSIVWVAALGGTIVKMHNVAKGRILSTVFYIAMGWTAIIGIRSIWASFPSICLWWILIGAVFYLIGVIFYLWRRVPYHHAIWHLFVIGGSVSHYLAVYFSIELA